MTLPKAWKGITLAVLLGVAVTTGLYVYVNKQIARAEQLHNEAEQLRGDATRARQEAVEAGRVAEELRDALRASMRDTEALRKELAKIKVPPVPTAPQYVADVITDLNKWGLNPLVGASNTVGRSAFGIRKDETQIVWQWGAQAQRVPVLEFKLEKTEELAKSLTNDRDLALKVIDAKSEEASALLVASDRHRDEADKLRLEVKAIQKGMAAERKKKIVYAIAGAVAGGLTYRAVSR